MRMSVSLGLCLFALLAFFYHPCQANILPQEVLVVYNADYPYPGAPVNMSANTAQYYAAERGIPAGNLCGIHTRIQEWFDTLSVDQYVLMFSQVQDYLLAHFNPNPSDPASYINNPAIDPIKCIVMCQGTPSKFGFCEASGSVDAVLPLLFQRTPWGSLPGGGYYGGTCVPNPYKGKSTDFGSFRASTDNNYTASPPKLSLVRYLSPTTAVAAGDEGIVYTGFLSEGQWQWTPVPIENRQFITGEVSDICVVDSQNVFLSSQKGAVIQSADGGHNWSYAGFRHDSHRIRLCPIIDKAHVLGYPVFERQPYACQAEPFGMDYALT